MPKDPIHITGGGGVQDGKAEGHVSANVDVGVVHGAASSSTRFGRSGLSTSTEDSHSIGSVLGSTHRHSEYWGMKGVSVQDSESHNLFGLRTERHTNLEVNQQGLSFGEHGKVAGHKLGYSVSIPNPARAMREGLEQLRGAAEAVVAGGAAHDVVKSATSMANQAAHLAEDVGHLAERLASHAPKDLDKLASTAANLATNAAHVASEAGKVAKEVGHVVGPVVHAIVKAL
ncbi:MAG: hypothetical protein K0U37_07900 [Gammaproteobacteria bacterium]|nr:hypothetical protein [Gammaproteobacteria bacterium]